MKPSVKITHKNNYTIDVRFKATIGDNLDQEVKGTYNVDTNVFYPELVEIFSVEQYATDALKCDPEDLYEALQEAYENRDR